MSEPKSSEATIAAARRIDAFLKDEAIGGALSRMERRYYEEFKAADTSEKRVQAWGKAKVLDDLERELKSILDAGEMAVLQAAKAAKKEH